MYKIAVILRYLRRKLSPLFAAAAVTLCTAMVIIVISVMGGFLDTMRSAVKTLEGSVTVSSDVSGFGGYEAMIGDLKGMPQVAAATPVITTFGLLNFGSGADGDIHTVEVWGIDPATYDQVVNYHQALFWTKAELVDSLDRAVGAVDSLSNESKVMYESLKQRYEETDLVAMGMTLRPPGNWDTDLTAVPDASGDTPPNAAGGKPGAPVWGIVPGLHVSRSNSRDAQGHYDILNNRTLGRTVTLTVLPLTSKGTLLEPAVGQFKVVNEFKSGLYEIDANRVYVPFDVLQKMLRMDAHDEINMDTGRPTGRQVPGRCTQVLVALREGANPVLKPSTELRPGPSTELRPGGTASGQVDTASSGGAVSLLEFKALLRERLGNFLGRHPQAGPLYVATWEEKHATFLSAVQNEKLLMTILFGVVSVVAFVMIAVVFFMIVMDKTRDIGVLRALGASRAGVAWIFLGYGLAVGVIGAGLGLLLASQIVWHLNEIQAFLGRTIGWEMWNPQVYYFDRIPAQMNATTVTWIVLASIASSVVGALIPAIKAARLNPVEALRYE